MMIERMLAYLYLVGFGLSLLLERAPPLAVAP